MSGDLLNMLYHMFDLLSIKGFTDLHIDIYTIMIRLFEWKKVPVGKLLAVLWKSRRLGHALCPSPIDPKFITEICKNHDELNKLRYWIKFMEESQPLIIGFEQCFFSMLSPSSYHHVNDIQSDLTVEKIKKAASGLISSVPQSNECAFLAAYLYYDLSKRLVQSGHMVEALFYAKEAHRLRSRLLQEKIIYSVEQQEAIYDETGELIQKCSYKVKNFDVRNPTTTEAWFCGGMSCDIEGLVLTPWNILQCYLESTLQEGTIHEILGNGSEAETLLLWGKSISCLKSLPTFMVSFSTILGKLYRKQRLWNLADTELKGARGVLTHISGTMSCSWCKSVLEVTISEQLGDLYRNRCCNGVERPSFASLSNSIDSYRSILINLNTNQSKTTVHYSGLASTEIIEDNCDNLPSEQGQKVNAYPPKARRIRAEKESRHLKVKDEKKNLKQVKVHNLRKTRSRLHNFQDNDGSLSSGMSIEVAMGPNSMDFPPCSHAQSSPNLETKCSVADILLEVANLSDKMKCLHCLLLDIHSSSFLGKFVCMRWELERRRLLMKSLINIAKCLRACGNIHEAREVLFQSLLLLINRNACLQYSSCPVTTLIDLIGEGFPRNILTIEGASLLYHICWMSLKRCHCNNTSQFCSELSSIGQSRIISWLRMVFIQCHEVPIIFQKVSRLLAALYIIYNAVQTFALPCKSLSGSHWASFFHQAGIGTHHSQELSSRIAPNGKYKYNVSRSIASVLEKTKKASLAPVTEKEFNEAVLSFFRNLPSIRVMCISCIGGADGDLLSELLYYPSSVQAWVLLSRLNADNHPISILLPANSLEKEASYDGNSSPFMHKSVVKKWRCPWVSSPVDDVAPHFKLILEENYASSSVQLNGNTKRNKLAWWTKRKELDERLGDFLHNMEQLWLGPLKYLLSEEWPDFRDLDSLQKKLLDELGYNDEGDDCQTISKNSPGNAKYPLDKDDCFVQIILNGGVYVHKPSNTSTEVESVFSSFLKTLSDTNQEINCIRGKPVMLVLDYEVQMLPWESLPILNSQEVYRMPSLYSISITLDRCCEQRDRDVRAPAVFPWIDPLDSYYVLNPEGDLSDTQVEFENWFKDQHFEGIAGTAPTIDVLIEALKSHDLFIYLGHGSGSQYFPGNQIKKLDKCSCAVLMGCSSGSLSLNGSYSPQGAPLYYLHAGSPVVVANLWEVTDKDIDRFGKAMLNAWLEERSTVSKNSDECDDVTDEMKSLSIRSRGVGKKVRSRKKVSNGTGKKHANSDSMIDRPMIGSFIGQARQACKLPFLIGAAPVCYGVPTGITRKTKL
ncbi:hypothetical protein Leryth_007169 [Lithospermum erythrorhizon]|nr:hypothetical protein Leryth_007169 [Lithospermum erythrorhizon]